MPKLE
jgi:dynein heavy chain, axonemal